ncbi:hypothetical protein K1T35_12860 [Pseudonocardia sp. DSM 110487]|uniref:hypothetical protein n=1 Tax=Pseudonocardia sp. DSM 110487 TaxID=2865833 RepID=UPI001C6A6BF7|nr:hypothetical protein [Pseudonocardia sp. DSM 110487]QYN38042.1 hypothetical protein K1T35_12860 [Pseudonocardia sp. DSM 110487]
MSYDLAVWYESSGIAAHEATRKYTDLCEEPAERTGPAHPQVTAFHRELTGRYPELDSLPADDERSPWSAGLTVTTDAVVMPMSWSRVDEVAPYVRSLAEEHGLVLYDPQNRSVHHPDVMRTKPDSVLSTCDGSQADDPGASSIERMLRTLSRDNWFAVLEHGGTYVQVGYGEQAGTRPGWYALERRHGSADEHFRSEVPDLDEVITAFTGFARHDNAWQQRFTWQKIDP